jgi:hypothetical protein
MRCISLQEGWGAALQPQLCFRNAGVTTRALALQGGCSEIGLPGLRSAFLFSKLSCRVSSCLSGATGLFFFNVPLLNRVYHDDHARQRRLQIP